MMARRTTSIAAVTAEVVVACLGVAFIAGALAARQTWLDRHVLPSFLFPHEWYVRAETAIRLVMGIAGVWLIVSTRARVGRWVARAPGMVVSVIISIVLAFAASEISLRAMRLRPTEWLSPDEEPRRQPDPRLGWTLVPGRAGHNVIADRTIEYAIDTNGYRVARVDEPVDPARPSIVFTGESVMFGEGLLWPETVPAQVNAMTGIQSAVLAVHGYGNDQAFLRLQAELPRFREPIAVVSLFMPALFGRNLDDDRPHLEPGLIWRPGQPQSRIMSLAGMLVPYRTDATIARGVRMTRDVLQATITVARAREAIAVIVVPQFGEESDTERMLRQRVLDDGHLPYVLVPIDPAWRLPWDRHPDARAAHAMAAAIAAQVRAARTNVAATTGATATANR